MDHHSSKHFSKQINPLCQLHFSKSHHQSKSFLVTTISISISGHKPGFLKQMDQISTVTQILIPLSLFLISLRMVTLSKSWWWKNDIVGVITWYTQQLVDFLIPGINYTWFQGHIWFEKLENWCLFVYFYSSSSKSLDFCQIGSLHDSCFCAYVTERKSTPLSSNPNPESIWS